MMRSIRPIASWFGRAVCRPRIDNSDSHAGCRKIYQWAPWKAVRLGYFAIRMKSDVIYETEYQGAIPRKSIACSREAFAGLILLNSTKNAEPLALINDGYLQHMRVGADSGIGAKYMAREDATVVGMIGSVAWHIPRRFVSAGTAEIKEDSSL